MKIFGSPKSSSGRCFWCLEEIGIDYEAVPINMKEQEHRSSEYLEINPNGKVPALVDGDIKIWESLAINFYLADKYKQELLGADVDSRAYIRQWSLWGLAEVQPPLVDLLIQKFFVPDGRRDPALIQKAEDKLLPYLSVLEKYLNDKDFLVNQQFSLADLNLVSIIDICSMINFDLNEFPAIQKWLQTCKDRPAFKKVAQLH